MWYTKDFKLKLENEWLFSKYQIAKAERNNVTPNEFGQIFNKVSSEMDKSQYIIALQELNKDNENVDYSYHIPLTMRDLIQDKMDDELESLLIYKTLIW